MDETAEQILARIKNDPSSSYWLRNAIKTLEMRDPVDSLHDVQSLLEYCEVRLDEIEGANQ